jgi:pilus assembly protein Flp/PilA
MFDRIGAKLLAAKYTAVAAVKKFLTGKEEGASLAEYGLLLALIAAVCIAALVVLGNKISSLLNALGTSI